MAGRRITIAATVVAAIIAVFLLRPSGGDPPEARIRANRPPVILVSVDTLRADHLGTYGYALDTSPAIDRFARDSTVYERGFAHSSETRFSTAALLSGFFPYETRVTDSELLPDGVDTLAEMLERNGYRTAAVVSNYVLRRGQGFEQGFSIFDDEMSQREVARDWPERIAADTTDRAIELLEELRGEPFFLWVHYQDPHGPYTPPRSYRRSFLDPSKTPRPLRLTRSLSGVGGIPIYQRLGRNRNYHFYVAQYDAEIRYLDDHVGRLFTALQERGLYEDSLIVFTADHGEALGEHNQYFGHMEYLYSNLTHVPFVIRRPGGKSMGGAQRRPERVQHVDLVPTLLGELGLEADSRLRGRDLRSPARVEPEIFGEIRLPGRPDAVRTTLVRDGLRLLHYLPEDRYELFDLTTDPSEEHDLAGDKSRREQLEALSERLDTLRAEDRLKLAATAPRELTEEERQNLRALGYVE